VRSIEHRNYLSDATLSFMKARGTFFVPTIIVLEQYAARVVQGLNPVRLNYNSFGARLAICDSLFQCSTRGPVMFALGQRIRNKRKPVTIG
jgi:hypothetical protein